MSLSYLSLCMNKERIYHQYETLLEGNTEHEEVKCHGQFYSCFLLHFDCSCWCFFRGDRNSRIDCNCQYLPHGMAAPHTHDSTDYPSEHIKVHEQYHLLDKDKAPKTVRLAWIWWSLYKNLMQIDWEPAKIWSYDWVHSQMLNKFDDWPSDISMTWQHSVNGNKKVSLVYMYPT